MENEKIAELIAERLYNPTASETDFAFQLFIERFVIPQGETSYNNLTMKTWVLDALNKRDIAINWEEKILSYHEQSQKI